jgi:hypothetical protein
MNANGSGLKRIMTRKTGLFRGCKYSLLGTYEWAKQPSAGGHDGQPKVRPLLSIADARESGEQH